MVRRKIGDLYAILLCIAPFLILIVTGNTPLLKTLSVSYSVRFYIVEFGILIARTGILLCQSWARTLFFIIAPASFFGFLGPLISALYGAPDIPPQNYFFLLTFLGVVYLIYRPMTLSPDDSGAKRKQHSLRATIILASLVMFVGICIFNVQAPSPPSGLSFYERVEYLNDYVDKTVLLVFLVWSYGFGSLAAPFPVTQKEN